MTYALRHGISYCAVGGKPIFLDEIGDRYFTLSDDLSSAFLDLANSARCGGCVLDRLIGKGVLVAATTPGPLAPTVTHEPKSSSPYITRGRCSPFDVLRAVIGQRTALTRIKKGQLSHSLDRIRRAKAKMPSLAAAPAAIERPTRAFEVAKLFFGHADRCLPRSIALTEHLLGKGIGAELVLGVTAIPFAAHAWVQVDDVVLNDGVEEVCKYTPVLRV
jgi:hypothetical protein